MLRNRNLLASLLALPGTQCLLAGQAGAAIRATTAMGRSTVQEGTSVFMQMREPTIVSPRVAVEYCTRCNWMLRSAWLAQEVLTTFNGTVGEVALVPNHDQGGIFEVTLLTSSGAALLWSRDDRGRFPESKEIKQLIRDEIDPDRDLGHSEAPEEEEKGGSGSTAFDRLMLMFGGSGSSRRRE